MDSFDERLNATCWRRFFWFSIRHMSCDWLVDQTSGSTSYSGIFQIVRREALLTAEKQCTHTNDAKARVRVLIFFLTFNNLKCDHIFSSVLSGSS